MPAWGEITGTLADQSDLQTVLDSKQSECITNIEIPFGRITGDINGDGVIDDNDLTLLTNHVNDPTTYPFDTIQTSVGDINNDGIIDSKDITSLTSYLKGASTINFVDYYGNWTYYSDDNYFYTDISISDLMPTYSVSVFINTEKQYNFSIELIAGYIRIKCPIPPINAISGWVELTSYSGSSVTIYCPGTKQDLLVSGTNIKTVNGNSILGSGNLDTISYVPKSKDWLIGSSFTLTQTYSFTGLTDCYYNYFDGTVVQESQVMTSIIVNYTSANSWQLRYGTSPYINVMNYSSGTRTWYTESSGSQTLWPSDTASQIALKTITLPSSISSELQSFINTICTLQPSNVTLKDNNIFLYPKTLTKNILDLSSNLKTVNNQSVIGTGNISVTAELDSFTLLSTNWSYNSTGKYYYQDTNVSSVTSNSSVSVVLNDSSDLKLSAECHTGFIRVISNKVPTYDITGWDTVTSGSGATATVFRNYDALLDTKQKKLTAGANITITSEGVISSKGGGGGGSGKVSDVTIDGVSITNSEGVANIPYAAYQKPGVVEVLYGGTYGIDFLYSTKTTRGGNALKVSASQLSDIDARTNAYRPIVPTNLDYAVKAALTDGTGAAWTRQEQRSARVRMGMSESAITDITVNGYSIVDSEGRAELPIASRSELGLAKASSYYGIKIGTNAADLGEIQTIAANNTEIASKTEQYKVITPANLDYAVKLGLISPSTSYTDNEKALARNTLGINLSNLADKTFVTEEDQKVKDWASTMFISSSDIPVQDVRAAGKTIISDAHIGYIPQAGNEYSKSGITYFSETNGFDVGDDGAAKIHRASEDEISYRVNNYKPIVPSTVDYAVKYSLSDPKINWTYDERLHARGTLGVKVDDVCILDTSIVDTSGTATIPAASISKYGVVMVNENYGVKLVGGQLSTNAASETEISARNKYLPITSDMLGAAVREGLGHDDFGITWGTDEQKTARSLIGIKVEDVKVDGDSVIDSNKVAQISFSTLATKIQLLQEQDRAENAETTNATNIANEKTRASVAEVGLQNDINSQNSKIAAINDLVNTKADEAYVDVKCGAVREYVDSEGEAIIEWANNTFIKEHQALPVKGVKVDGVDVVDTNCIAQIDLTDKATKTELSALDTNLQTLITSERTRAIASEDNLSVRITNEIQSTKDWADAKFLTEHQYIPVQDVKVNGSTIVDSEAVAQIIMPTKLSDLTNDCGFTKVRFDYDESTNTLDIIDIF